MDSQVIANNHKRLSSAQTQEDLYGAATRLLSANTLEATFRAVVEEAILLVRGKYASIFMPQGNRLVRVYASAPILYEVIPRKMGNTYNTFVSNKPILINGQDLAKNHPFYSQFKVGSDITVPLSYEGMTVGVLSVLSPKHRLFGQEEFDRIRFFSPLASLAIHGAQNRERLRQAIKSRDLFISMAAHELRTPLTVVTTYSQLIARSLKRGAASPTTQVERLLLAVRHLTQLVNQLLLVDSIQEGLLPTLKKRCGLTRVINRAIEEFKVRFPKRTVVLDNAATNAAWIMGDPIKLQQAFQNLLHNAAKFSPARSVITVRMRETLEGYEVDVVDNGEGIAPIDLPHIFERFYRSGNHKHEGMGLGLFSVKAIIEQHDGTINVDSQLNLGSTFTIRLPPLHHDSKP